MHTQTLDAQTTQQPEIQQSLPAQSKPTKTVIRRILSCAVLLAIGFTSWGMLREEFDETFHMLSACHTVAPDRTA
jgi:hypothetical protein